MQLPALSSLCGVLESAGAQCEGAHRDLLRPYEEVLICGNAAGLLAAVFRVGVAAARKQSPGNVRLEGYPIQGRDRNPLFRQGPQFPVCAKARRGLRQGLAARRASRRLAAVPRTSVFQASDRLERPFPLVKH